MTHEVQMFYMSGQNFAAHCRPLETLGVLIMNKPLPYIMGLLGPVALYDCTCTKVSIL